MFHDNDNKGGVLKPSKRACQVHQRKQQVFTYKAQPTAEPSTKIKSVVNTKDMMLEDGSSGSEAGSSGSIIPCTEVAEEQLVVKKRRPGRSRKHPNPSGKSEDNTQAEQLEVRKRGPGMPKKHPKPSAKTYDNDQTSYSFVAAHAKNESKNASSSGKHVL
jgi:hypothetical protein